jgi:hypothetical protein
MECDLVLGCNLTLSFANGRAPASKAASNVDMVSSSSSHNFNGTVSEPIAQQIDKIFVIDHFLALNQIDLLENCEILSNLVVPDSVLKYLNRKNIQSFHALRNA